jgi:hypothetical protein
MFFICKKQGLFPSGLKSVSAKLLFAQLFPNLISQRPFSIRSDGWQVRTQRKNVVLLILKFVCFLNSLSYVLPSNSGYLEENGEGAGALVQRASKKKAAQAAQQGGWFSSVASYLW